jgi:hypothetical protein
VHGQCMTHRDEPGRRGGGQLACSPCLSSPRRAMPSLR